MVGSPYGFCEARGTERGLKLGWSLAIRGGKGLAVGQLNNQIGNSDLKGSRVNVYTASRSTRSCSFTLNW